MKEEQRFWANVRRTDTCWLWMGAATTSGHFGVFIDNKGKRRLAHCYALDISGIEYKRVSALKHQCQNPFCVHPKHIKEQRGETFIELNRKKIRCPKGHPYTGFNNRGQRLCSTCMADACKRWRRAQ